MRAAIEQLKQVMTEAKARQKQATEEAKRVEKDMNEFSKNKDSKLTELQVSLDKLKKSLTKQSAAIKPLQQEVRDAMLEAEQCGSDLFAAQEQSQDAETTLRAQKEELAELSVEQTSVKVSVIVTAVLSSTT